MNKRMVFALILVFLILFISGCSFGGREGSTIDTRYHRGSEGIRMLFLPNQPPSVVYDDPRWDLRQNELTILVEIQNRGAFDIGKVIADRPNGYGYLTLSGFDEAIIANLQPALGFVPFEVGGRSRFNAEGEKQLISFPPLQGTPSIINLPIGVDYYKPNLLATACYEYFTEATPMVCIDPDPYNQVEEKSCRVGGIATSGRQRVAAVEGISGGQGAPVTIRNVEQIAMPGRSQFKIYISNTGGGKVISWESVGDHSCPFSLNYQELDNIDYIVTMHDPLYPTLSTEWFGFGVSGRPLTCQPEGRIKMINNQAILFCTTDGFDFTVSSAYKTPLSIRLSYGYMDSVSKQIEIRSTS